MAAINDSPFPHPGCLVYRWRDNLNVIYSKPLFDPNKRKELQLVHHPHGNASHSTNKYVALYLSPSSKTLKQTYLNVIILSPPYLSTVLGAVTAVGIGRSLRMCFLSLSYDATNLRTNLIVVHPHHLSYALCIFYDVCWQRYCLPGVAICSSTCTWSPTW